MRRAFGSAIVIAALAACQDPAAIDAVTLEVFVSPLTLSAGDTARILVDAINSTDRALTIPFDTDCQFLYRIVTPAGLPVAPASPWFCTQGRTTLVLSPRSALSVQFDWVAQVNPGSYRVFGYLGENREREAGPVTITVN